MTLGTSWGYSPDALEIYKSAGHVIALIVETRAKGGNLLVNIGPMSDGTIPMMQEELLRELSLWMFVNSESIYSVRPWVITNENDIWCTRSTNHVDVLYAIVIRTTPWPDGVWQEFVLKSVNATASTNVSILGQDDKTLEYHPMTNPKTTFRHLPDGLHIRAMHTQRLHDSRKWYVVLIG